MDPYFSKPAVLKLESVIRSCAEELCQRLHEHKTSNQPASITVLARCFTSDAITEYIFGSPYGFLSEPIRSEAFFGANNSIAKLLYMWRESYIIDRIFKAMRSIPIYMLPAGHMAHTLMPFMNVRSIFPGVIFLMLTSPRTSWTVQKPRATSLKSSKSEATGNRVLMEEYLHLDLPEHDKSLAVQFDTAGLFVSAGFETVAFTTEHAIFHVLDHPALLARLKEELGTAIPDQNRIPSWTQLEKLPYLSAVIQESLRMSVGVMPRLSRKNTKHDLHYKQWTMPKNTYVGMSNRFTNYSAEIFPDPFTFNPDRWLQGEESKELDTYGQLLEGQQEVYRDTSCMCGVVHHARDDFATFPI